MDKLTATVLMSQHPRSGWTTAFLPYAGNFYCGACLIDRYPHGAQNAKWVPVQRAGRCMRCGHRTDELNPV